MKLFAYVSTSRSHGVQTESVAFFVDPAMVHPVNPSCLLVRVSEQGKRTPVTYNMLMLETSEACDKYIHHCLDELDWHEERSVPEALLNHGTMHMAQVYRGGVWYSAVVDNDFIDHVKRKGEAMLNSNKPDMTPKMSPKFKAGLIIAAILVLISGLRMHGYL